MKTVRTRVKSALKRNSKGTPAPPSVQVQLPAASTSAPSVLLPETANLKGATAPPSSPVTAGPPAQQYAGFHLESEPETDYIVADPNDVQQVDLDLTSLKFTGDEPERIYASPQPIIIKDDSRRGTPKKRIKSVPRLSSDCHFPSPSIASRIQTTLPPAHDTIVNDIKFVSPVDPNYLIEFDVICIFLSSLLRTVYITRSEIRGSESSLLDQPAPTDRSFVEATPTEVLPSLPPLHEILTQSVSQSWNAAC
jgi:hypothetical protein